VDEAAIKVSGDERRENLSRRSTKRRKAVEAAARRRSIEQAKKKRKPKQTDEEEERFVPATPELLDLPLADETDEERTRVLVSHRAEALKTSRVRKARECPIEFARYAFRDDQTGKPIELVDFQREFQNAMSDESIPDVLAQYPRDHGKTTNLEINAIHTLGNDPNERIKIVCASDAKAVERLFAITQHLEQNDRVHDVFPWLKPADRGSWTKHKIVVERPAVGMRDASIEALGVLSTATGGRSTKLYFDDAVDRRNALELPKLRETVKQAIDSDWTNLLEPGGKRVWVCTPWHTADATHHLIERGGWYMMRHAVGDNFEPVWPEKWGPDQLRARLRQIGQREFDRAFRLIALSGDIATVNPEWIAAWEVRPTLGDMLVFSGYDLSTGEGKDFFAACHVGLTGHDIGDPRLWILDAYHAQFSFLAQAEAVKRDAAAWIPNAIAIEATQYQAVLPQVLRDTTLLPDIVPVKPRISKALRLLAVSPYLESGRVRFNPALLPHRLKDPQARGSLVTELTQFPLAKHDDLVDAFIHAVALAAEYSLRFTDATVSLSVYDPSQRDRRVVATVDPERVGPGDEIPSLPEKSSAIDDWANIDE
jgi:phage terminase large subunit-like protein